MEHIVAGHFQEQQQVEETVKALTEAGFALPKLAPFYLTPPREEPAKPNAGKEPTVKKAESSSNGSLAGILAGLATGAAAGATAIPVLGASGPVIGALAGASVGSLAGGLSEIRKNPQSEPEDPDVESPPQRQAGWMLAIAVDDTVQEGIAFDILQRAGAEDIEEASSGTIVDGHWWGFDPLQPLKRIERGQVQVNN